jgi:cold shock CspA family protein
MEEKEINVNEDKYEKELVDGASISGKVVAIKVDKGYGFIEYDTSTKDHKSIGTLFFHFSSVDGGAIVFKSLVAGNNVTFKIASTNKGNEAVDVMVQRPAPTEL